MHARIANQKSATLGLCLQYGGLSNVKFSSFLFQKKRREARRKWKNLERGNSQTGKTKKEIQREDSSCLFGEDVEPKRRSKQRERKKDKTNLDEKGEHRYRSRLRLQSSSIHGENGATGAATKNPGPTVLRACDSNSKTVFFS
jgi:hypothetical protein